jgi:hypothetical protein
MKLYFPSSNDSADYPYNNEVGSKFWKNIVFY